MRAAITATPIEQWVVSDRWNVSVFEEETAAVNFAFQRATSRCPATLRYPSGTEYVILRRDDRDRIQVVRDV